MEILPFLSGFIWFLYILIDNDFDIALKYIIFIIIYVLLV